LIFFSEPNYVIQNFQTSSVVTSHQKCLNTKVPDFLKTDHRRRFASSESLNGSLAQSVGKL